jgi:hypothetical protein
MRQNFVPACLIALALLACQVTGDPASWISYPSGSVIFQDEFSDPSSGWVRAPDEGYDYTSGVYQIRISEPGRLLWSGPSIVFRDVRIEVDAIPVSGEGDDDFGIVCRAVDEDNFYFLVISSDAYYGIGKVKDGVQSLIGMAGMPPSEQILKGQSLNHLRADCIEDQLSLYANGQLLATVQDPEFKRGRVGLLAGTLAAGTIDIVFDNFSVLAP